MPTPDQNGAPPKSPEVAAQQQGSPLGQLAQQAAAQGGPQAQPQGNPTAQFVMQAFQQVADIMGKIGQGLMSTAPQLVDLLKKLAGGFKELETQYQQVIQQGSGASPQGQSWSEPTQNASEDSGSVGV